MTNLLRFIACLFLCVSLNSFGATYTFTSFTRLGDLPNGITYSRANDATFDGSYIVGDGNNGVSTSYVYNEQDGLSQVNSISNNSPSSIKAISSDGSTSVGWYTNNNTRYAMYTQNSQVHPIGLGGQWDVAYDVSGDGSSIVGFSQNQAFELKNGNLNYLGFLNGGWRSVATRISSDGSTITGYGQSSNGNEAFIYQNGVMMILNDNSTDITADEAWGISGDGTIIVGNGTANSYGRQPFVYKDNEVLKLGTIPSIPIINGYDVFGISDSGHHAIGYASTSQGQTAVLWDIQSREAFLIEDLLFSDGFDIEALGWSSIASVGISGDGLTILGYGNRTEGGYESWAATLAPVPLPAGIYLFLSGFVGLVGVKLR